MGGFAFATPKLQLHTGLPSRYLCSGKQFISYFRVVHLAGIPEQSSGTLFVNYSRVVHLAGKVNHAGIVDAKPGVKPSLLQVAEKSDASKVLWEIY